MFTIHQAPVIQETIPSVNPKNVRLFIKREDLLHPVISGNKWRKLKYNLIAAKDSGETTLLTFGGAYSNHIHAVAGAASEYGFKSIGIIRGEAHLPLNPTLMAAQEMGMQLHYMDRTTYRQKQSTQVIKFLEDKFGKYYLIPEGGTNLFALKGAAEIVQGIENAYDYFCAACGTGGTVSGIISALDNQTRVIGYAVVKGEFHQEAVGNWLSAMGKPNLSNWQINTNYHFGGYAKFDEKLIDFINIFKKEHDIRLDPIYTGKLLYGVFAQIANGKFPEKSRVLAIHTGGLQGIKGFNLRFNNLINV